jgi:hypothetical protein
MINNQQFRNNTSFKGGKKMTQMDKSKPVMVNGATGYVAGRMV